jgi:RNA polymerase sigma-70 factor (ECF subfamily)
MELIAPLFEPTTLAAFRRMALDGLAPAQAAEELGLSLNAILVAKSRVLSTLRQETKALID